MTVVVEFTQRVEAPIKFVWDYLGDYRNTTKYIDGMIDYTPVGAPETVLGAEFDGTIKFGPMVMKSRVRVTNLVETDTVTFESIKGVHAVTTNRLVALSDSVTEVNWNQTVDLGRFARPAEKLIEPFGRRSALATAELIATLIPAAYAEAQSGARSTVD